MGETDAKSSNRSDLVKQNIAEYKLLQAYNYDKLSTSELKDKLQRIIALYNQMLYHMHGCACRIDDEHRIVFMNKGMISLLGYDKDDCDSLSELSIFDLMPDSSRTTEVAQKIREKSKITTPTLQEFKTKDGSILYALVTSTPLSEDIVGVNGTLITLADITERKKVEDALSQSEERYRTLVENAPDAIIVHENGIPLYANSAALKLYEAENFNQFATLNLTLSVPSEGLALALQRTKDVMADKKAPLREARIITLKGNIVPVEITSNPTFYHGKPAILMLAHDISPLKKTEELLKKSEEQFRRAIEDAPIPIIMQAENGEVLQISKTWTELTGYSLNEVSKFDEWLTKTVYGKGANKVRDYMHELFKGDKSSLNIEFPIRTKTGEIRYWSYNASSPGTLLDGRRFIVGMAADITERKKSHEALILSEKRYRRLFETSQDGIMARNLQGQMIDCNQAYADMLGYTKQELSQMIPQMLICEKYLDQRERINKQILETGESVVFEREYRRKDGSVFPASVRSWRLMDEKEKIIGIWSTVRDITQQVELRKKLEQHSENLEKLVEERSEQLKDSERLATIGATAGMVGHDLRNPLQAIASTVYLMKLDLKDIDEGETRNSLKESLDILIEQTSYMNKIVSDLQSFVMPVDVHKQTTNFKELITSTLAEINLTENVETNLQIKELTIETDPQLLKRVLFNLITNAVQAMPHGGQLNVNAYLNNSQVQIVVEDTGVGVSDDVKSKLFTPLFTTKAKGQGFGLAVCKRVIEAQSGTISFESQVGKGTKFMISLPV